MGLLPLEFSDCLLDSPYFRENLKAHEKQQDQTSHDIKTIIHNIQQVIETARVLTKAKKTLAGTLESFQFDCLGTSLTDDEIIIANSLKEFAKFLCSVEDEMGELLKDANDRFVTPLMTFRKEQIGSVKQTRKSFEKQTAKFCAAQDKFVNMSSKKEESLAEAAETFRHETKALNSSSLEYVYLMHVVQEKKKFEFVEKILDFREAWVKYYKYGNTVACHYSNYMEDLKSHVKKSRDNFSATAEQFDILKKKMASSHQDPGKLNKMYTRQGYLFLQSKKNLKLGTVWTKYFCQYQARTKTLTMIPYSQLTGKITSTECLRVMNCVCKDDSTEKFHFALTGENLTEVSAGIVSHTVQALGEFERKNWVEALGGTWPAVNTLQRIKADSVDENLNSVAFTFLKDCLNELEVRGLNDRGLYRVSGVASKVKRLLNQGLDPQPDDTLLDLGESNELETKTIASAVKQYFRDLNKPLLTYNLYNDFVEAAKNENEINRINEIYLVLQKLPIASREILKVLIRHLSKVSAKAEMNLMTPSNLSVCFGPTLLWPKEKTVASIMDIKFCNEVVEILIENCDRMFPETESSPDFFHATKRKTSVDSQFAGGLMSSSSNAYILTPSKLKHIQSFNPLSQTSANSLPDIREFHLGTIERPRSKSHQLEFPPKLQSKEESPTQITLRKLAIVQDDLTSSLEMMTSLAADLPSTTVGPHKGHYLPNKNKRSHLTPQIEILRKPPLPKLTTVALSPSDPPSINVLPNLFATPVSCPPPKYLRMNSDPTPRTSSTKSGIYKGVSEGFLKPCRPSDLPGRLISAFEGLCTSSSQKKGALNESLVIHERNKKNNLPSLPIRQFKKMVNPISMQQMKTFHPGFLFDKQDIYAHKPNLSNQSIESVQKEHSLTESLDQISPDHDIQFTVMVSSPVPTPKQSYYPVSDEMTFIQANSSSDGGMGSSFIKPQYSEYTHNNVGNNEEEKCAALNKYRKGHHADVISSLSCSLSEESDASEFKYDNVNFHYTNKNPATHGDKLSRQKYYVVDDERSECREVLENTNCDSSEGDTEYPDMGRRRRISNGNSDEPNAVGMYQELSNCLDKNRNSGQYENVNLNNLQPFAHKENTDKKEMQRVDQMVSGQTTNV